MAGAPILVVDDAPLNLKLIRLVLTHEGYEVRTAERAEQALAMLSTYRPDLILADIQMPGMDGLDMTRRVKEEPTTSSIRVVALTACDTHEDRDRALRAGCEDYITKPINTSALAAKVRQLLTPVDMPAPVATKSHDAASTGLSGAEIESLQRRFLNEGLEHSRRLADSLPASFNPVAAAGQLHKWAGSAALVGFPEIAAMARNAEGFVHQKPLDIPRLLDAFTEMYLTFSDLRDRHAAPASEALVNGTKGKHVALVGFTPERADAICEVLQRGKALPMLFDAEDATDDSAIRNCDVVIFYLREETSQVSWLQPGTPFPVLRKLVFMGDQSDLIALSPEVRAHAADFLVDRADAEEILMRLAFAVSDARPEPVAAIAAPAATIAPSRRQPIAAPKVVLADDDNIVLTVAVSALRNHGMTCRYADNGIDALKLIRTEQPHLAVLDVNMPGMSGFEILAAVRQEQIPTRIILLTAFQREEEMLLAFRLGADDYLTKPFNPFELVARSRRLVPSQTGDGESVWSVANA